MPDRSRIAFRTDLTNVGVEYSIGQILELYVVDDDMSKKLHRLTNSIQGPPVIRGLGIHGFD